MKNKITLEENQTIEINGAVLNTKVISQIKSFQDDQNDCIESFREYIADSICFMVKESIDYSGLDKESRKEHLINLSSDLAYCRDFLNNLKK